MSRGVSVSATFSAASRQMVHRMNSASPSFHSFNCRSKVAGYGRHGEVRDCGAREGESQLGVGCQIADDGDDGVACHGGAFTIGFAVVPDITRVVFAEVKQQRGCEYIEAAVSLGAGRWWLTVRIVRLHAA